MGIIQRNEDYSATFVPPEEFNWGAFLFTYFWGLGNGSFKKTYPILICEIFLYIPVINFIAFIVYIYLRVLAGSHGNQWAYEGRAWYDEKEFRETQKHYWQTFLVATCALSLTAFVIFIIGFTFMSKNLNNLAAFGDSANITLSGNAPISANTNNPKPLSPLDTLISEIRTAQFMHGQFKDGNEIADYIILNPQMVDKFSKGMGLSKYSSNSIKIFPKSNPRLMYYLFIFKKEGSCNLKKKNCSVIMYHLGAPTDKAYFDDNGNIKHIKIKIVKKK